MAQMATTDKRSFNNADLSPVHVAAFKKKSRRLPDVQIKVGSKKIELAAEAFLLTTDTGHAFLSLQPINAVLQVKADNTFEAVLPKDKDVAVNALKSFRASKAKPKARAQVDMDEPLKKALASIPKGYKLVLKGSSYQLVKSRERSKK